METTLHPFNRFARLRKFCLGFEYIIEAVFGDGSAMEVTHIGSGAQLTFHARLWNPAYWVGWFRCRVLGDRFGAALYEKPKG